MKATRRILVGIPLLVALAAASVFVARWGWASLELWRARQAMEELQAPRQATADRLVLFDYGMARLDHARALDPHNPDILDQHGQYLYWQAMNLADAGLERGRLLEQAVAQYRKALSIRPLWPYTWANLVVAKAEWGIFDPEFRHAVRRTVETGPWEPRVQLQLIRVDFAEQDRIDRRSRERIDEMLHSAVLVQAEEVLKLALRWRQLPRVCPLLEDERLLERCRRGGWDSATSGSAADNA